MNVASIFKSILGFHSGRCRGIAERVCDLRVCCNFVGMNFFKMPKKIGNSFFQGMPEPFIFEKVFCQVPIPKTNSSPLRINGWKMKILFRMGFF